ncbi:carboxypeptidase-like regulatory domain-containing protein [Olivibacter sp. SDN3]|uniref:DUF5686 and carboxypeptidase regulatory-like domain-containing protein n=1 Tax=Olivibacter sp. SDN3 TaxID=2764720 RepID=UPI0016516C2B|nr:DUF5686 and carboxypeptidase regulatory-like domain-containing protein [Olivibacter sp. SDN3]QNL51260.1 carboxypeptidase-like regulatory domain-containing protein [Olivibacter sp. SDN3]
MKPLFTLNLLFFIIYTTAAQTYLISGKIVDQQGNPIPFASVFKANTSVGTSANSDGYFKLKLTEPMTELVATAVGYHPKTIQANASIKDSLVIQLAMASYMLQEVVIGNTEDPAYAIIRQAIKKRSHHLNESGPYHAHVYIKGLQRLIKAPRKFLGVDIDEIGQEIGLDSNRQGIIYLSESESNITVNPPKDFKEKMISSKVSGDNRAFSFNRASELQLNFYENYQQIIEGLSNRPFVSPIADNAFSYYRYEYLGSSDEDGLIINKIKVIPKRPAEPLYKGDIYIVENDWRIHSVNLLLDKKSSINFVDSLNIKQLFTPITNDVWMPSNIQLDFKAGALGFHVGGYFTAIYQDYAFIDTIHKRTFKEALNISREVNKKDTDYWNGNRPIPLTMEEVNDYTFKDSLRQRRESKAYLDSIDQKNNRFKPLGFLLGGYNHRNRYKKEYSHFGGLLPSLLFNSVEGLAVNYQVNYSRQIDSTFNRYLRVGGRIRYGFANKRLHANVQANIPLNGHSLTFSGGRDVLDLNNRGSLPVLFNSLYTLFAGENYQKLYEKTFATAHWDYTLPGNVRLGLQAEWARRHWLPNATAFTFWDRNRQKLTSNNPLSPTTAVPLFEDNDAAKIDVNLSYNFSNRYETYPTGKRYLPSKYPTLSLHYTKGLKGILGSDVDYDLLTLSAYKSDIVLGMMGKLSFAAHAGKFLRNNTLFYPDYRHFNGNQILFVDQQLSSFLALDYYQFSTRSSFLEAHTEYNLAGLLTSKVPLLRKFKLEEIIGLHYLHTPELGDYGELHAGLQWKVLRVIYAHGRSNHSLLNGTNTIRIGLKLF